MHLNGIAKESLSNFLEKLQFGRITKENFSEHLRESFFIEGSNLHPNPNLYKYTWWIYHQNLPQQSAAEVFYKPEHALNTFDAFALMEDLSQQNISFAYVNMKQKRLGVLIWDYAKILAEYPDEQFAPSFEDDRDPLINGHK